MHEDGSVVQVIYCVMEKAQEELFDWYVAQPGSGQKLSNAMVCSLFHQMLDGTLYLHLKGFAHRDFKLENFVLNNGILQIIDFGHGTQIEGKDGKGLRSTKMIGTTGYQDP